MVPRYAAGAMLVLAAVGLGTSEAGLTVTDLSVDYLTEPLGIDNLQPHFSWRLLPDEDTQRSVLQDSYRLTIQKADSLETVHDSGVVHSSQSTFVQPFLRLESNTRYNWSVQVGSEQMTNSTFLTGLLQQDDWAGAEWLEAQNGSWAAVQMRQDFVVTEAVKQASLFVCVPGYGTVSMNGRRVDGGAGIRSWSQYDRRALYSSYDVTDKITIGNNTLGIYTGRGWYSLKGYGPPTARAVLALTLSSGKTQTVYTDGSWQSGLGPITYDDEYNGEIYDARLETPGWDAPGFKPGAEWVAVKVATKTNKLQSSVMGSAAFPAVEKIHKFNAKKLTEPSPGVWVIDFEQNLSGWCAIYITGKAGTQITIRHAEALQHPPYGPYDGNIYVGNLRGAKATDTFILKGDPNGEHYEPLFTQHGFRYIEITGLEAPPTLDMVEAVHVRSAVETTGSVSFSDDLLNQVQHNLYWGQSTNLMMVPTDCDQRDERLGWTGDSALTAEEAIHNFDMGAFYMNWAQMLDDTSPNGAVGCVVPGGPGAWNLPASKSCDASWTSVYPTVLHGVLKFYGDTSTPEKHWASLTKFIDNEYSRISSGGITKMFANFGDWVPPPPAKKVSTDYTSAFSFLNDLRNVVFMAQKLGHADDASRYQAILTNVSNMFHSQYFDSNSNSYADGGQTAQVLALKLGVVPDQHKQAVVSNLVQDIIAHGNHTSCGIIGWRFQCEVLSAMGHADLAYALMTQRTYPSYGFEIFHPFEPATTIWELWDGPSEGPGMNSRDHIMFGGPGYWLYSYVGGISQTKDSIGFEHAVFTPPADLLFQALKGVSPMHHSNTSAPLKWASVSKTVPRGEFGLSWQLLNPTGNTCAAATPEGTTAKFQCPGGIISSVVFASYGTSTGDCTDGFKPSSCNADLSEYVKQQCVGKSECSISCANNACGSFKVPDPCFGTPKHVSVQVVCTGAGNVQVKVTTNVPANSDAQTNLPTLGAPPSQVNVTEGGKTIWSQGKYVPGVPGISAVTAAAGEESSPVTVVHGSGKFEFQIIVPV